MTVFSFTHGSTYVMFAVGGDNGSVRKRIEDINMLVQKYGLCFRPVRQYYINMSSK